MDEERRKSITNALENYYKRNDQNKVKRKNEKPEKETEREVLEAIRAIGFSVDVYEAKGVFDPVRKEYLHGRIKAGTSDIIGCTPNGRFACIELKARGSRSKATLEQIEFIKEKVLKDSFGCVVDCKEYILTIYSEWIKLKTKEERVSFLLKELPKPREIKQRQLNFDD